MPDRDFSYCERSILATLIYYDFFDFPLGRDGLWYSLVRVRPSAGEDQLVGQSTFDNALVRLLADNYIEQYKDRYFLPARAFLVPLRRERERIAKRKRALLGRICFWLGFIPTIEAIFVSGSLAYGNTSELSDLDILIVSQDRRIWLTRLCALAVLALLRRRRTRYDTIAPDMACPNHFITRSNLHIPFHSRYNAQTYMHLRPMFIAKPDIPKQFIEANPWLKDFGLQEPVIATPDNVRTTITQRIVRALKRPITNSKLGEIGERLAKKIQLHIIGEQGLKKLNNRQTRVCDNFLAFHDPAREADLLTKFQAHCASRGIIIE